MTPMLVVWKPVLTEVLEEQLKDPEFKDYEMLRLAQWFKVWQSRPTGAKTAVFDPMVMETSKLCNGDLNRPVKVSFVGFC